VAIEISDRTYDLEFIKKLQEISGEAVSKCMQCGTCSAVCPMHESTDLSPRQIILFSQYGMTEKIYSANTVWLCATCNACMAKCPRGLDLTKVMEAIRQMALRKNENFVEPNQIPEETLQDLPQIALVSCFRKHTS
jgi:heterodisulfide reductase subunit C2